MTEKLPTSERLARALEAENDPKLQAMIELARSGYYDDCRSPLATPIIRLVTDLQNLGHWELAGRAIDGEFDATRKEWEEWEKSPDGQETMRRLKEGK